MQANRTKIITAIFIALIGVGTALFREIVKINVTPEHIWSLIGVFLGIVVLAWIFYFIRKNSDPFEVINITLLSLALYSLMLPINKLVNWPHYDYHLLYEYMMICILGLIGFLVGYHSRLTRKVATHMPSVEITDREICLIGVALLLLGVVSFAMVVMSFGGLARYIAIGYGPYRHLLKRATFAFGSGVELIGVAIVLLALVSLRKKKYSYLVIILLFALAWLSLNLLVGSRRVVLYFLAMLVITYNYAIRRVNVIWLLLAIIIIYFFFFTYSYTRRMWPTEGIIGGTVETYNFMVEHPHLLLPFASGEFIPPAEVIEELMRDSSLQLKWGTTYVVAIVRIFPRVGQIFPKMLETLSEWRLRTYHPGVYETGAGLAFFTMGEGYVNFGRVGVFLHMVLYGFFAGMVYQYYKQRKNIFAILLYASIYPLIAFEGIRDAVNRPIWDFTHIYFGPLFLFLLLIKFLTHMAARRSKRQLK
jgi:oligosaccharide repeat unit polymerase